MLLLIIVTAIILFLIYNNTGLLYRENSNYQDINFSSPLKGGEPYEFIQNSKKAILFVHGFPGSPKMFYMVREMAVKEGYDVFSPRLPGFSSTEEEFIKTNFSMWFKYVKDYYMSLRDSYDTFYVVGHSMGGALTLKLTQELEKVQGPTAVAVVSAPVFLSRNSYGPMLCFILLFVRFLSKFITYIPPGHPPKSKDMDQDGDTEWIGYRGKFPRQIYSLLVGIKGVKRGLARVKTPCYLCQAKGDRTVPFKNLDYIVNHISSEDVRVRELSLDQWEHTKHSLFLYKSVVGKLWEDISDFFDRYENRANKY